ncbi:MAG: DMT family transporter [Candidatus Izimaplasma sp.]|nr:DMT family transporter [Candidatus Izimaplasma bacterium]
MKKTLLGYILAFTTITIWSSTFVVTKVLVDVLTPVQILSVRILVAVIVLLIIYPKINKTFKLKNELLFIVSGVALGGYFIFENSALTVTFPSNVSLFVATSPLFTTFLVSFTEEKKQIKLTNILGLILAFVGVGFIVFGDSGIRGFNPLGDILAILAALMFSVYTVTLSHVKQSYHIIQKTRKVFLYAFLIIVLFGVFSKKSLIWPEISITLASQVLFLAIFASSFAFIFWNKSIDLIGTVKTNVFIYLIPVVTMILSAIFINEMITLIKLIGAVLIISGIYISEHETKISEEV